MKKKKQTSLHMIVMQTKAWRGKSSQGWSYEWWNVCHSLWEEGELTQGENIYQFLGSGQALIDG